MSAIQLKKNRMTDHTMRSDVSTPGTRHVTTIAQITATITARVISKTST